MRTFLITRTYIVQKAVYTISTFMKLLQQKERERIYVNGTTHDDINFICLACTTYYIRTVVQV